MGDWQDGYDAGMWGEDGIPYAIDSWGKEYEIERDKNNLTILKNKGYKTIKEWNIAGKIIKKGEKGTYLKHLKVRLFAEEQTIISKYPEIENQKNLNTFNNSERYFKSFQDAIVWAKKNPYSKIMRIKDDDGFLVKTK